MASEGDQLELRSVIFLAGHFDDLLSAYTSGYSQLDGVLELLDFANAYVLSDRIAIGGAPANGIGDMSWFLRGLAEESQAIELIGHGQEYHYDLRPFEDQSQMDSLLKRRQELKAVNEEYSTEGVQCFNEVNLLEARAYILLADTQAAAYIPDRIFGIKALERYPQVLDCSEHLKDQEVFRSQLVEQLRSKPNDDSFITQVPSFLLEAVHQAQTWQGIFAALSDMRHSTAAQHYRDLIRRTRSDDINDRRESRLELVRNSQAAFKQEGLSTGLNRWIVPTLGLSAAAIGFLFPAARALGLVGAALPLIGQLRSWYRERNNLFEIYNRPLDRDLYDELSRIFPIKFHREHLSHFLSKRDFGWSQDLKFWQEARTAQE